MKIEHINNQYHFFNDENFSTSLFLHPFLEENNLLIGSSIGRGTTWFFKYQQKSYVLRHYYRGGLIAKINNDHFLYQGLKNSRAYKEFQLLKDMHQLGLPVPIPYAGKITRSGLFYQADLIIELIDGAKDLVALLTEQVITQKSWFEIGRVIRLFHEENVYHSDMNSHNIMLDCNEKVWLIDFDKCFFRKEGDWKEETLQRLLRSLRKEKSLDAQLHWQESDWVSLMKGYQGE